MTLDYASIAYTYAFVIIIVAVINKDYYVSFSFFLFLGRQSQANIYDQQALAYGLFHAVAQPIKPFGIVTTGVSFKGLNMDVGHVRSIRWEKANNTDGLPTTGKRGNTAAPWNTPPRNNFWWIKPNAAIPMKTTKFKTPRWRLVQKP